MESDAQDLRASRLGASRLRPPSTQIPKTALGLTELSESQSNVRSQVPAPSGIPGAKRGVPQPAAIPEAKRKPLSQQAGEYPSKYAASTRGNVQGVSLVGAGSGIKQPGRYAQTTRQPPNNFGASRGPETTRNTYGRPKTSQANHGRSMSAISKPSDRRPQSSYGDKSEEPEESSLKGLSLSSTDGAARNQANSEPPSTPSSAPQEDFMPNVTLRRGGKSPPKTPSATHRTPVPISLVAAAQISNPPSAVMIAAEAFHERLKAEVRRTMSPTKSPCAYLTKYSDLRNYEAWDVSGRLGSIEQEFARIKSTMENTGTNQDLWKDQVEVYKARVTEMQQEREELVRRSGELSSDVSRYRDEAADLRRKLEDAEWKHGNELDRMRQESQRARDDQQRSMDSECDRMKRTHREEIEAVERQCKAEADDARREAARQMDEMQRQMGTAQQDLRGDMQRKDDEVNEMRSQLEALRGDLDREMALKGSLQSNLAEMAAANVTMEAKANSLRSQIEFLESDSQAQSTSFEDMEARLQEAIRVADEARRKLMKEETERRVLFNKYQELKGNIRVMCRVRPVLGEAEGDEAGLQFPDDKTSAKIGVMGPEEKSSLGVVSRKEHPFEFDRVFTPAVANEEIFGEISQLVQSALDGFNVCIFCYGQTGSGKTYTMSSPDGMIPRATHMIYETVRGLEEKSWSYTMEGSFVEVYNEELHDLLGSGSGGKKLEIRHDEVKRSTSVTNCRTVKLDSADTVETMLEEAQANRAVAATRSNERSSRSHSVFALKLVGENSATGERCEGTLNLVDLAGSERVKSSGAEGERMREAQSINKSLSCLGDVIDALGKGSPHVPYRNSRLTHLLQYSLGGNSKTLMFVMVSPLEGHLRETLTSLRFAAKVHNTHIGTAKASKKIKDRTDS